MPRKKKNERGRKGEPWYRKHNNTWYIDYNDRQLAIKDEDGGNIKGSDNKDKAKQCWMLMQAKMLAPEIGDKNPLRMVFSFYLDHIKTNHPDCYPAHRRTLVGFADSLSNREFLVKELTANQVDEWLAENSNWSDTTKASYIAIIQAALNWAAEPNRRLIPANPIQGYRKPRRRSRGAETMVSQDTHDVFLDHVPEDFQIILRILRDTGTRPGNICHVTAAHCDWENGGWWFSEANATNGKIHKTHNKTGESLFVPVSEKLMEVCRQLAAKYPDGPLFRTEKDEPWNSDKISQRFDYYKSKLAKMGIPMPKNYFAYCYRHTRLTELLQEGVSETIVAAIAGHKGTNMLHQHYSHILAKPKILSKALNEHLKDRDRNLQSSGDEEEQSSS